MDLYDLAGNKYCDFSIDWSKFPEQKSGESNIYTRYVSELESEIRLLADLSMIVEMKMERIKDKYCSYE